MGEGEFVEALQVIRRKARGRYHRLYPTLHPDWDVTWRVECPFEVDDDDRPCKLVEEASDCRDEDCQLADHPLLGHVHPGKGCAMAQFWEAAGPEAIDLDLDAPFELWLGVLVEVGWVGEGEYLQARIANLAGEATEVDASALAPHFPWRESGV